MDELLPLLLRTVHQLSVYGTLITSRIAGPAKKYLESNPDLKSVALMLVIAYISLAIMNIATRWVIGVVRFAVSIVFWVAVVDLEGGGKAEIGMVLPEWFGLAFLLLLLCMLILLHCDALFAFRSWFLCCDGNGIGWMDGWDHNLGVFCFGYEVDGCRWLKYSYMIVYACNSKILISYPTSPLPSELASEVRGEAGHETSGIQRRD
ncbi:hypothetical protein BDD12DRAFT_908219 [Trichophaea hybrida]|nr:hypothetical protein BDD12DRAFT_908219 [Trichophaea hybrida]